MSTVVFQEMRCPECSIVWGCALDRLRSGMQRFACPHGHVGVYDTTPRAASSSAGGFGFGGGTGGMGNGFQGFGAEQERQSDPAELRRTLRDLEDQLCAARARVLELEQEKGVYRCPMYGCEFSRKRAHLVRVHLEDKHGFTSRVALALPANAGPDGEG